jgi:hypothetical protein
MEIALCPKIGIPRSVWNQFERLATESLILAH